MTPETAQALKQFVSAAQHRPKEVYQAALSANLEAAVKHMPEPVSAVVKRVMSLAQCGVRTSPEAPGNIARAAWAGLFEMADLSVIEQSARFLAGAAFRAGIKDRTARLCAASSETDIDSQKKIATELATIAGEMTSLAMTIKTAATVIEEWAQTVDASPSALRFPLGALDEAGILLPRSLTLVGAYPGVGKTAFLVTIAKAFAEAGRRVFYLVLEDDGRAIIERAIASAAKIGLSSLKHWKDIGPIKQEALQNAAAETHRLLGDKLLIASSGIEQQTQAGVQDVCERAVVEHGAEIILVDHLGEIKAPDAERHDLAIDALAGGLRRIADTYRVPVVSAVHLKRREGADVDTKPRLTDIAFSSGLERKARLVFGLHKSGDGVGLTTLKNTSGRCANFNLEWEHPGCTFSTALEVSSETEKAKSRRGFE
jgi:replicative DNA helicase